MKQQLFIYFFIQVIYSVESVNLPNNIYRYCAIIDSVEKMCELFLRIPSKLNLKFIHIQKKIEMKMSVDFYDWSILSISTWKIDTF